MTILLLAVIFFAVWAAIATALACRFLGELKGIKNKLEERRRRLEAFMNGDVDAEVERVFSEQ